MTASLTETESRFRHMLPLASLPLLTALSPTVALSRSQAGVMMLLSATLVSGFAPTPVPCEPVCDRSTHDYKLVARIWR